MVVLVSRGLGYDYPFILQEGPWTAAAVVLLLALRLLFVEGRPLAPARGKSLRGGHALLTAAAVLVTALWHVRYAAELRGAPIDARVADMLPLLLRGFEDLARFETPYRPHQVPWTLTNYFLPATFAPYFAVHALGVDVRWINVAVGDCVAATLFSFVPRRAPFAAQLRAFAAWALLVPVFGVHVPTGH